jgi:hypothetical protein
MTYREPARATTRRTRIRWIRVAGLLLVIAAIAAAGGCFAFRAIRTPPLQTAL